VKMFHLLWLMVFSVESVMADLSISEIMKDVEDSTLPLKYCDFHFKGFGSIPPILNLQYPGRSLSSNIVTRSDLLVLSLQHLSKLR
jgi:hypothetical protein